MVKHHIQLSNFRHLKDSQINFNENQTILIDANNSRITSTITAMIWILKQKKQKFSTRDFTLFNKQEINAIGNNGANNSTVGFYEKK